MPSVGKTSGGLRYTILSDKDKLRAIVVEGQLDDARIKDLQNASKWTFERALERMDREPR